MIEIPKRLSLIDQAVESIRQNLHSPGWTSALPSERVLSDLLQVSRPTVRAALEIMRHRGLIETSRSGYRRFPASAAKRLQGTEPNVVCLLTCASFDSLSPSHLFHLYQLRRHLQDAGVRLEVVADVRLGRGSPLKLLREHMRRNPSRCWILHHSTPHVQRWFQQREVPVIAMGSCYNEIRFPSLDWDYPAMCSHAVRLFVTRGHRRMALLRPKHQGAGENVRERAFLHACDQFRHEGVSSLVIRHDGSANHLHAVLRTAMNLKARPTAILASESMHTLNALTLLVRLGIHIPDDVSLISCDEESYLSHVSPTVACYRPDWNLYARRLSRMAVQLANTGVLAKRPIRIIPSFQQGESLGFCAVATPS